MTCDWKACDKLHVQSVAIIRSLQYFPDRLVGLLCTAMDWLMAGAQYGYYIRTLSLWLPVTRILLFLIMRNVSVIQANLVYRLSLRKNLMMEIKLYKNKQCSVVYIHVSENDDIPCTIPFVSASISHCMFPRFFYTLQEYQHMTIYTELNTMQRFCCKVYIVRKEISDK